MGRDAIIESAQDGPTLKPTGRSGDHYRAHLVGPNFGGTASAYEYEPVHLKKFFDHLAANWRGWTGKREWGSLEGELSFSATSDSTGHITLLVQMRSGSSPFDWRLSATLLIEAGKLGEIAASIGAFVDDRADR